MLNFIYTAIDFKGNKITSRLAAKNKKEAVQYVRTQNLQLVKIVEDKKFSFFKPSQNWVIEWAQDVSFLLLKGLSLVESLLTSKIRLSHSKQNLIDEIIQSMHSGENLSNALSVHKEFPNLLISFLSVAEVSGEYASAFADFAVIAKEKKEFSSNLWKSLQYPIILILVMFAMLIGFSEFLLPSFLEFFQQNDFVIESSTMIFIEFARFIKLLINFLFNPLTILFAGLGLMFCIFFKPMRMLFSKLSIKIPLFGSTYLKLLQHLYLKTFSKLLSKGHHLDKAVFYSADIIPNIFLKKRVLQISKAIETDGNIAESIGFYLRLQPIYISLLKTGEKSASLASYSEICADTIQRHFQLSLQRILTWTGPLLVTTMGIVTIFMVIAIVLPLYEQVTKIG